MLWFVFVNCDHPSPVKSLQAVTKLFFVLCAFGFIDLGINIHFDNTLHIQLLYCARPAPSIHLSPSLPPSGWFWFHDFTKFEFVAVYSLFIFYSHLTEMGKGRFIQCHTNQCLVQASQKHDQRGIILVSSWQTYLVNMWKINAVGWMLCKNDRETFTTGTVALSIPDEF